jgi:DNA-binding transcriptional MocR family regulator
MLGAHKLRLLSLCEADDIALIEDDTYSEMMDEQIMSAQVPSAIKS